MRHTKYCFLDKASNTVHVGDFTAYGSLLGRCAALKFGKVIKIEKVSPDWDKSKEEWHIRVIGVEDWQPGWRPDYLEKSKPGTLMYPDRILLANDFIPEKYKEVLEC